MTSGPSISPELHAIAELIPPLDKLALFLDVDGTLVGPHHSDREEGMSEQRLDVLRRLVERTNGATVILTGRAIDMVDQFFAPLVLSIAGMQGVDRRYPDGRRDLPVLTAEEKQLLEGLAEDVAQLYPHVEVEWKSAALAFVYPENDPVVGHLLALAFERVGHAFKVLRGRVAIDIVPLHADKGTALHDFMQHPTMAGRIPVHLGDDTPDEPAFVATRHHGGFGVTVSRRVDGVDVHLDDHNAVWDLLSVLVDRM